MLELLVAGVVLVGGSYGIKTMMEKMIDNGIKRIKEQQ